MKAEPRVSTIIPTYNRAALVCAAIDSVRRQTYRNVEIVVVDDGSTDDTQARLRAYGSSIQLITQDNAGPAVARNRGIEGARGEIITFLDSDDTWRPTKLERQVRLLEQAGDAVTTCICNTEMVFPDGHKTTTFQYSNIAPSCAEGIWLNVAEVLASRFLLFTQAAAVRRKVIEKVGGFDESLRFLEDYEFPLRLALEGPWAFIRDPLVIWQQDSPGSWTTVASSEELRLRECAVQMRERLWEKVKDGQQGTRLRDRFLGELKKARRLLYATQLGQRTDTKALALRRILLSVERYRSAVYRRSPWFPKVKASPIG